MATGITRVCLRDLTRRSGPRWWTALLPMLMLLASALSPTLARARPSPADIERLRSDVAAVLQREGIPGVGLALVRSDGVVWSGGVGTMAHGDERPVTADTLYRVASITKSFVGLTATRLHERGLLPLGTPLAELLPDVEIDNPWHDEQPVTIAHALEHTAGFDDMRFNETFGPPQAESWSLTEILRLNPRSRRVRWRPGTRHSYANPGYTVVAAAIEQVSQQPFEDVVDAEVFSPLGVRGAFRLDDEVAGRLATGYQGRNEAVPYHVLLHWPAGSLMMSSSDLARLVQLLLRRGEIDGNRLVSPEMLERIETDGTLAAPATDVAYGLGNYGDLLHGVVARGHDGGLPGYLSCYRYFPELGFGYVMLLPATHSISAYLEIRQLLFQHLARDVMLPTPPVVELPPEQLDAYAGYYEFASPRHELLGFADRVMLGMRVTRSKDHLLLSTATSNLLPPVPLIPTGEGRFRFAGEGGTSIQFHTDDDGETTLTLHRLYFERRPALLGSLRASGLRWAIRVLFIALAVFAAGLLMWVGHPRARAAVDRDALLVLAPPASAAMALWSLALLLRGIDLETVGALNITTALIFVLTLVFAAMAVLGSMLSIRVATAPSSDRLYRGGARLMLDSLCIAASLAAAGLTVYGALNHLIGLRTWAW